MQNNQRSAPPVEDMQAGQINLSGRVALITGGGRGIGATISLVLAQAGADVVINYNTSEQESKRIKDKIEAAGGRAAVLAADVGDTAQCAALVHQAEELFGQVDILVSNAGIGQPHKIVDTPDEEWERVMNVNAGTGSSTIARYDREAVWPFGFHFVKYRCIWTWRRILCHLRRS